MDRLDLRSGCELYTSSREAHLISADGTKTSTALTSSTENLQAAIGVAEKHGLRFEVEPVRLVAGEALERLASKGGV